LKKNELEEFAKKNEDLILSIELTSEASDALAEAKLSTNIYPYAVYGANTQVYVSEEIATKEEVAKLYVATFNRAPDSLGLDYWISSGLSLSQIAQSFFNQSERRTLYPDGTSNSDFITSVYQNLFNREPDTDGLNYWEAELNANRLSKNRFIEAVINGAQNTDTSNDSDILNNKMIVALSFSEASINNLNYAKTIMANVTADSSSVDSAINSLYLIEYRPLTNESFTVLKNGYLDVNESVEKKFQLVYDQEKFNEVYKTFDKNTTIEIDFTKQLVAVLELGKKTSKDYFVKVTKIEEVDNYRTIFVETTILDKNCPKGEELVTPFEIVAFDFNLSQYEETLFKESVKVLKCDEVNATDIPTTLSFRELLNSNHRLSALDMDSTFQIVQDSKVYEDLYYNHISPVGTDKELPYVDFANETLVALFLGSRGSDIQVKSLKEYNNYIEVEIEREIVGDYCVIDASVPDSATFVVFQKTDKEIVFKDYPNVMVCEPLILKLSEEEIKLMQEKSGLFL